LAGRRRQIALFERLDQVLTHRLYTLQRVMPMVL
jgi:hypothetical protein